MYGAILRTPTDAHSICLYTDMVDSNGCYGNSHVTENSLYTDELSDELKMLAKSVSTDHPSLVSIRPLHSFSSKKFSKG